MVRAQDMLSTMFRHWHVVALMHQKICNGNLSQRVRQKINGSVKDAQLTVIALAVPAVSQRYIKPDRGVRALLTQQVAKNDMLIIRSVNEHESK